MKIKRIIMYFLVATMVVMGNIGTPSKLSAQDISKTSASSEKSVNLSVNSTAQINEDTPLANEELIKLFDAKLENSIGEIVDPTIKVDDSTVNYYLPGTYDVTFSVIDIKKNFQQITSKLTINDLPPQLLLANNTVHINLGEEPSDYLSMFEVSATEVEKNDLLNTVKVDTSQVDFSKPGQNSVIFTVQDNEGTQVNAVGRLIINGNPDVTIPEPEVPLDPLPEPEVPLDPLPEPEVPLDPLPEPEVPLDPLPEPEVPLDPLPEPEVPLDPLPEPEVPLDPLPEPEVPLDPLPEPEVPLDRLPQFEIYKPTSQEKENSLINTQVNGGKTSGVSTNKLPSQEVAKQAPTDRLAMLDSSNVPIVKTGNASISSETGKNNLLEISQEVPKAITSTVINTSIPAAVSSNVFRMQTDEKGLFKKKTEESTKLLKKLERPVYEKKPKARAFRVMLARVGLMFISTGICLGVYVQYRTW